MNVCRRVPVGMSPFFQRLDGARELVVSVTDASIRNRVLNSLFQGMFMLVKIDSVSGLAVVEAVGSETQKYNPKRITSAVGRNVAETFDGTYGNWIADHYLATAKAKAPIADDVDAVVFPTASGPRQLRYSRLSIPIETSRTNSWVLSVTAKR
jgi:hypothetical protein